MTQIIRDILQLGEKFKRRAVIYECQKPRWVTGKVRPRQDAPSVFPPYSLRAIQLWQARGSVVICNLCLHPPSASERERRGWRIGEMLTGSEALELQRRPSVPKHSGAREWLNDPILGSLLDTRQRCMKIDTQVLDSVCWIIKRIDIILQPRMKTK